MARHYNAFLLRTWRLGGGTERFEVAHIQSGESTLSPSLAGAIAWLGARLDGDDGEESGAADNAGMPRGQGREGPMPE